MLNLYLKVVCPYCMKDAVLTDSAEVYGGRSFGLIWLCRLDSAWVGIHKNSHNHAPLGRLANKELREWKMKAHTAFDALWKDGLMTRKAAYSKMQSLLDMTPAQAHIGKFDVEDCMRLVVKLDEEKTK